MDVRKKVGFMPYGWMPDARHDTRLREAFLSHGARSSYEIATSDAHQRHMRPRKNAVRPTHHIARHAHARG